MSFAIKMATREVEDAQEDLKAAEETKDAIFIKEAQDALDEAKKVLAGLNSNDPVKAKKNQERYLNSLYAQLGPNVAAMVQTNDQLAKLVQKAVTEEWDQATFDRELKTTDWWDKRSAPWQKAFALEYGSSKAEWKRLLKQGRGAVEQVARQMGIEFDDERLDELARSYYYQGWNEDPEELQSWLAQRVGKNRPTALGDATQLTSELKSYARDFGLSYDDGWYARAVRKVLDPKSGVTVNTLAQQMAAASESLFPAFKGRLGYGSASTSSGDTITTLRDAAADYVSLMAKALDIQASDIDMNDGLLEKALNSGTGKDSTEMMSLYDFGREVRRDARWAETKQAKDLVGERVDSLLKSMGLVG